MGPPVHAEESWGHGQSEAIDKKGQLSKTQQTKVLQILTVRTIAQLTLVFGQWSFRTRVHQLIMARIQVHESHSPGNLKY